MQITSDPGVIHVRPRGDPAVIQGRSKGVGGSKGDPWVIQRWSSGAPGEIRSCDHMIMWSYDQVIIWSYGQMILWSYDHMVKWSCDHIVIMWSYDHEVIWSCKHMIVWSNDVVIIWSYGELIGPRSTHKWNRNMRNAMGRPESGTKRSPNRFESIPSRSKIDPESTRDHPEATWGLIVSLSKTWGPKRTPFGIDFASFHDMKLTKHGFQGVATTRMHVKEVAFLIGRYWKYSEKVSSPCELRNRAIGNLLVQN